MDVRIQRYRCLSSTKCGSYKRPAIRKVLLKDTFAKKPFSYLRTTFCVLGDQLGFGARLKFEETVPIRFGNLFTMLHMPLYQELGGWFLNLKVKRRTNLDLVHES